MVYIWFFQENEWMFQGICGFSGVLMISVPLFRNSFVPHSLDRVTSFQVHITPVLQMWVLRWPSSESIARWPWKIPPQQDMSMKPAFVMYLTWAFCYYTYLFVIQSKTIQKRGYETLYKHMSVDMGLEKALPQPLQNPLGTKAVFMLGHFMLFLAGVFAVHLQYWSHTVVMCGCTIWGFKNGANFYMTYFWRVYEEQITAFEKQRSEAQKALQEQQTADNDEPPPTPQNGENMGDIDD
jgi:hypothetical protein